jgi:hypothetical protein
MPNISALIEETKEAIKEIYSYSLAGGGLHIVLDDENAEDAHIRWCQENSIPEVEDAAERRACERCAKLLLQIPIKEREELLHSYGRTWW